jgi:CYTH domain-containing protein
MREPRRVLRHRYFVIAPSLARLIQKERGGERVLEGYFPDQPHRSAYVQIEETRSSLILEADGDEASEERVDLPPTHAQALLAVSHGQVEYLRIKLLIGAHEIQALHVVNPSPLDLVVVTSVPEDGQDLPPLPWFGPEVSGDPAYQRRRLALDGAPDAPEVDLTNAALNSLLDLLEERLTVWPRQHETEMSAAPATAAARSRVTFMPEAETGSDEGINDLGIEDAVIRELARSLQPRQR